MTNSDPVQVLSRLSDDEFIDRELELEQIRSLVTARRGSARSFFRVFVPDVSAATSGELRLPRASREAAKTQRASNALVLGSPRAGKTEILRKSFDHFFNEGAEVAPVYYALRPYCLDPQPFARDYLSQFLAQFIAFRRDDARLIAAAHEPLAAIARAAPPEDYLWIRSIVDSFSRAAASGDTSLLVRVALCAPMVAASRSGLTPLVMVDNFHLLAPGLSDERQEDYRRAPVDLRAEFIRALGASGGVLSATAGANLASPAYVLCGLRRPMLELIPPDEELFDRLEMIRVEALSEDALEKMILSTAARLGIEMGDSTNELMVQQLNRDLFYIRALLDAAASRGSGLKTFMEFERVYTEEVLSGRIAHYLGALLRDVAPDSRSRRAALEALGLVTEAGGPIPIEALAERAGEYASDVERLLARLHARELMEISFGFVTSAGDPVLADYVRAKYRSEIVGTRRPVAGQELLGEKLKHSHRLMMSRYNRAIEGQLVELLARFDFQSAPTLLFDQPAFDTRYRGMNRVQARRSLDEDQGRIRLPQIVLVNDAGSGSLPGNVSWRLFAASGFDGGTYSESNEVVWLIALINSKEPLDIETLDRIEQRLESSRRTMRERTIQRSRIVRWYISREGFSVAAAEQLSAMQAHISSYSQLDLLYDFLVNLTPGSSERKPASEFELVIPIEDDAELIAARTAEQIARAADFDQEAINQIKTALIEACINAAEHSDSPDRRIYQRFAVDDDRLTITVSNKGRAFGLINGSLDAEPGATAGNGTSKGGRGRGLKIIRALMDEVRFERTDDGATLVMTKFLKRPQN